MMPPLAGPARAGHLGCACPEDGHLRLHKALPEGTLLAGFALVVLAQALTLGVLPLAGAMVAPRAALAGWPMAAFLLGAAAASFPASLLLDAFGRRAAFAIGGGLGVAGGLAVAHAILAQVFPLLVIGAIWLGAAQGFGLFYRHAAALGAAHSRSASAIGRLLAAGALAGLLGPILAQGAEQLFLPYTLVGTALVATLAQLGVLAAAVLLPAASPNITDDVTDPAPASRARDLVLPTLLGALAWAAMASSMVAAPLGLATCGVTVGSISGIVAWHVVAMYAPALAAGMLAERIGTVRLAMTGAGIAIAAALAVHVSSEIFGLTIAFLGVGTGWSVATSATSAWIHRSGMPARSHLAFHDVFLLLGATVGAALANGI
jgi:hypothetical protein